MIRAQKEVQIWRDLCQTNSKGEKHPNIVEYIDSQVNQKYDVNTGVQMFEMLILCELCEGGFTLINMIEYCKRKIPEHVVLNIMKEICQGV